MALRLLAQRWAVLRLGTPGLAQPFSTAPSVYDKLVQFTIVDLLGRRHVLRGLQGQTLVDVIEGHVDTLGEDAICASPEGCGGLEAHVKLPNELLDAFPAPDGQEALHLEQVADAKSLDKHSRLGSRVVLNKGLDGAVIALGQVSPWKTL